MGASDHTRLPTGEPQTQSAMNARRLVRRQTIRGHRAYPLIEDTSFNTVSNVTN